MNNNKWNKIIVPDKYKCKCGSVNLAFDDKYITFSMEKVDGYKWYLVIRCCECKKIVFRSKIG